MLLIINKLLIHRDTMMRYLFILPVAGMLALACCSNGTATVAGDETTASTAVTTATTDADTLLTVAEAALAAYKATSNPNAAVVAKATTLLTEAQSAVNQYGPEASTAIAAVAALSTYLLTAAPGNGVTPASA